MEFVDWRVAQRVGELIAGTPPFGAISSERVEPMAHDFAVRVAAYSGLRPPAELPRLELVDRPVWIAANLRTMRPLLGRLSERAGIEPPHSALAYPLRSATGLLMGAQVGALTGMLSQTGARPVRPGAARRLGPAPAAAAGPEPGPGGGGAAARPRRTGAVGDDPRDHPRGPVLGGAVAARAPRRADHRADRRPRGQRQLLRRAGGSPSFPPAGTCATSSSGPAGESCCG